MFPPVSNYRRFLIHRCVEELGLPELATFSIGISDERRTIVCYREKILSDEACARPVMGLKHAEHGDGAISQSDLYHPNDHWRMPTGGRGSGISSWCGAVLRSTSPQLPSVVDYIYPSIPQWGRNIYGLDAVGDCKPQAQRRAQPQEKIRSGSTKPRRPDRAVYVPRALRAAETSAAEDKPPENKRTSQCAEGPKCPKSPGSKEKSTHGTPRKSIDKTYCNVYTPPHLRNQRSHVAASTDQATASESNESVPSGCEVPNSDSATTFSDNSFSDIKVGENFYIGDYFANGQLGFYAPPYYSEIVDRTNNGWQANEQDENMAVNDANQSNIIKSENDYLYNKDEDFEKNELKRASQEINRSSKRIIKQSFDSDVLVISDPIEETNNERIEPPSPPVQVQEPETIKTKQKLEPKVSLKREENDWDAVFDDSGECLDPSLLEELTSTVGKVHITKVKNNYDQYQTRTQQLFNGPYDETFAHVIEVYDFPSEFKTNDLLSLFSEYKDTGFEIKWVDDTHALIVFSSAKIAAEVLSTQRALAKCRPLHAATLESRNKAKKCAEFLQPYRQRPETCTALARRLVSGALGVKLSTARQERAEERRLITIAREKKRQAALHKEAAWDGSLANQSVSES